MIQNGNIITIADIYGDIINYSMYAHTGVDNTHNYIGRYCFGILDCLENLQKEEISMKAVQNAWPLVFKKGSMIYAKKRYAFGSEV